MNVLGSLYLNDEYSDITIICRDEVFPAHRSVLCTQSPYFKAACNTNSKEDKKEIKLDDCNPALLRRMLEFLYKGDYSYEEASSSEETVAHPSNTIHPSLIDIRMYAMGDYFQISGLRAKAMSRFRYSFWNNPTRTSFAAAVTEVYRVTTEKNRELRVALLQTIMAFVGTLRCGSLPIFDNKVLKEVPDFMYDICIHALDRCSGETPPPACSPNKRRLRWS